MSSVTAPKKLGAKAREGETEGLECHCDKKLGAKARERGTEGLECHCDKKLGAKARERETEGVECHCDKSRRRKPVNERPKVSSVTAIHNLCNGNRAIAPQ